ncbi:MAG: peptide chain release factor N(5)-glutamine methyltransferase [Chthonomonas sp.]|nr:peptide chain release factor N(5)-glutamine methyltransferase [Chthonomonas sp.]
MRVRDWLTLAEQQIDRADARILFCFAVNWDRAQVMARLDHPVPPDYLETLSGLLAERALGVPLAYLVGSQEFFGRPFLVNEAVLIPRPDTETLIEVALGLGLPEGARVLDVGTGSGCIALTLAAERPSWDVTGVDISADALAMARANAHQLKIRATLEMSDLFQHTPGPWDLVVSNPPYIGRDETLPREVREFEPDQALFAEESGLAIYRRLADEGRAHTPLMLVEIGYLLAETVPAVFAEYGWSLVSSTRDLAGIERAQLFRQ